MPKSRHDPIRDLVRTAAVGFSSGYRWSDRRSDWGQLLWTSRGAMTATIGGALWTVPSGRALWISPDTMHDVTMIGRGILRSVYLVRSRCRQLPRDARLITIAPMLRELIRRAIERNVLRADVAIDVHHTALLTHELATQCQQPATHVDLPLPRDPRALAAAQHMLDHPGVALRDLAITHVAAASRRTLERLFPQETELTLGQWHQRAALAQGLRLMASGHTVSQAALASGYSSTSAFIAAFKRLVGTTPGQMRQSS
jgi:AraC-like DNA-binding protein